MWRNEVDGLKDIKAADINNDDLLDVVYALFNDDKIAWHGNSYLSTKDITTTSFTLFTNPANDIINIRSMETISFISISNVLGQEIHNSNVDAVEA